MFKLYETHQEERNYEKNKLLPIHKRSCFRLPHIIRVTPGNASSVLENKVHFSLEKHADTNNHTLLELVP